MPDNLTKRGAPDRARVNLHEAHERRYWMDALRVTQTQLEQAVARVGTSAAAVRQILGKN